MKVAYLLTQDKGGPVDVTVRLAATLIASGEAEVRVFGPVPSRGAELIAGHHQAISVASKGDLRAGRRAREALRAWQPDVVHAQDRRAGLVSAGLRLRHRVVQTYHGVPDDVGEAWFRGSRGAAGPSGYTRTVLAADAGVARFVHRTVVPAPAMGEFLVRRLRVPSHRVAHIDNCVELPGSCPPRGPVRRLVFVGLLVARKGLLSLLDALAMPGVMPSDASLTVIGDGPLRAAAQEQAARDLAGRVEFLGFRTDVPEQLRRHDALVLPSTMEQQPLVVAEAMAAGKPVVATDTGGVGDMLADSGGLVAAGDVAGLAARLAALFADPDPGRVGRVLAERARARFAPEVCAERHLALYRELVPGS
ncbi:glycosyltransferase involved in cell wall biosynthesis [Saccharothrix tamanrassetensis]|uniref:Glycosyltransferase involved in cell wall biosynthesis n=1 Tax=Saccharothrix tamanrassetensis TaxID=1051531 RepID=A0A841CIF5_9PSEU|nr:glycosyltransferase family 4 protein [Saccharothrix tamanrassetensis]MBB5957079.1 glycosyltransferase involved in cell wall biosynthesis [Saccharothrix tamanrassetensis]